MARPQTPAHIQLRSARMLNVDKGELVAGQPAGGGRPHRRGRRRAGCRTTPTVIDLGDVTLLPGLMDMEVNLLLGGPDHRSPLNAVQDDPAVRTLRAVANARRTLRAGFTTVRNLGLFIQTGGLLLDVALKKAIDLGLDRRAPGRAGRTRHHADRRAPRPHDVPGLRARTSCRSPSRRASPTASARCARPSATRSSTARRLIKVCASGGVMSHTGPAGAQQYSDEELRAIVDEAHRAGLKVAAHAHGDDGIRAAIEAGIDCIEHGSLMSDETLELLIQRGTFLVPTTYLADGMDVSHAAPELQAKAAEVFPRARETISKAIERGARVACGTDAPGHTARSQRQGAARARRPGHDPAPGASAPRRPWRPSSSTPTTGAASKPACSPTSSPSPATRLPTSRVTEQVRFVMKGGRVYRQPNGTPLAGRLTSRQARQGGARCPIPYRRTFHSSSAEAVSAGGAE